MAVCMSVAEEAIRKATGRVVTPLECWGSITTPDTMRTGSTPTLSAPTVCTQMLQNTQSGRFKSTSNTSKQWEGTGVPRVSNMKEVRHTQPQLAPCLHSSGLIYPNIVMRKEKYL